MDVDDEASEVHGPLARLSLERSTAGDDVGDSGLRENVEEVDAEGEEGELDDEDDEAPSKGKGKADAAADEEAASMLVQYPDVPVDAVVEFTDDVSPTAPTSSPSTVAH